MTPKPSAPAAAASPARLGLRKMLNEPEPDVTLEKRSAPRRQTSLVPSILGVRLSPYGADATLVNISTSGVLVECSRYLKPGSAVTVVFDGSFSPSSIESRVARSSIAGIDKEGAVRYDVGIAFKTPIGLDDAAATATEQPEPVPMPEMEMPLPLPNPTPVPAVLRNRW